jgi:hypothetical protein
LAAVTDEAELAGGPEDGSLPGKRPPPKSFCILLPVWGDTFITRFLERSLLTLLADGNIPAMANALPTRFVFLTQARDEAIVRAHPVYSRLRLLVSVDFLPIDDLITRGNHSTTITLAYERAVRREGAAMLDTCFVFLVSDYIVADGSLAAVAARMVAGASAVQVGNFQLTEDTADSWLLSRLVGAERPLSLNSREMMRWALACLHPVTVANIVNYPLCHNTHSNRLFWRVDPDTLIGRFYLLHMICIRPETVDFVVGASCDYSFVPEMCPSGNVSIITDSDDYLVVEIQPHGHETRFLRFGPGTVEEMAESLSEWTTASHRANAEQTIVFHADALPRLLPAISAEADEYIRGLAPRLSPPQPHRNHPYWLGATAAFDAAVAQRGGLPGAEAAPVAIRAMRWAQKSLIGRAPEVTRPHPRWRDYKELTAACRALFARPLVRLLIGANESTPLTDLLRREVPDAVSFTLLGLLRAQSITGAKQGDFDAAFIEIVDNDFSKLDQILRYVAPLIRPGGQILVVGLNPDWSADPDLLGRGYAVGLASAASSGLQPSELHVVSASRWRWNVNSACVEAAKALIAGRKWAIPLAAVRVVVWGLLAVLANMMSSWRQDLPLGQRVITSVLVRFQISSAAA